jgi:DNA repair ATPase RecN
MTAKEALEILKSRNTTLKLNHKIGNRDIAINEVKDITKGIDSILPIIEQALTELEELKEFISDIFTDKELNQWIFDNRINLFITLCGHILRIKTEAD